MCVVQKLTRKQKEKFLEEVSDLDILGSLFINLLEKKILHLDKFTLRSVVVEAEADSPLLGALHTLIK